jgi:hypothetical protein
MKTLGRITLVLLTFGLVMGLTYLAVNARSFSTSSGASAFERGAGMSSERPEFHGEDDGRGSGWIFGMLKNGGIIAVIVALMVIPKNLSQKTKRSIPAGAG